MKTYLISYQYMREGTVEVQAESLEQAKETAKEMFIEATIEDERNENYVDGSFETLCY